MEVRKTFKMPKPLDDEMKKAINLLNVTESAFIKMAVYDKIRGVR